MSNLTLEIEQRSALGKGPNHRLREAGFVPGVFYNKKENMAVQVAEMPLKKAYAKVGTSQLFNLQIKDGETKPSIIKSIVMHPTKNKIVHVDFYGVDLSKKLRVSIPVEIEGTAAGAKEGGILTLFRDAIEVECLPTDIPEKFVIDVSGLGINDTVHISEVAMPDKVEAVFEENFTICGVTPPAAEEPTEEEELEGEAAEGEEAEGETEAEESTEE